MDLLLQNQIIAGQNTQLPPTASMTGALRVAEAQGRYFDSAIRGHCFWAASQAATTWSVALNTTHTGFVLSNPRASGVYLVPLFASFALSVAPAGIAPISLFAGNTPDGIVAHTTPLVEYPTLLDSDQGTGIGNADAAATLVGTPRWIFPIMGGFTAAALPSPPPPWVDLGGIFIVPPGAYIGIGALTAVVGFASMLWEEVPIPNGR
jgi:hypothetical protein